MERGADGSLDPLFSREPMPHGQGQALPPKAGSGLQTAWGRGLLQSLRAPPASGLLVKAYVLQSRVLWVYLHIAQAASPGAAPQHTGVGAAGGEQKGGVQTAWACELEGDVPWQQRRARWLCAQQPGVLAPAAALSCIRAAAGSGDRKGTSAPHRWTLLRGIS